MELQIFKQPEIGVIEWNFDELKKELSTSVETYRTIVYTSDDQIKNEAKPELAKLRKLNKALDDERRRVKNIYTQPIKDFEAQVKELTGIVNEAIVNIDEQVKGYEDRRKAEKLEQVKKAYEEVFADDESRELVSFETAFVERYLNATVSIRSILSEFNELKRTVLADVDTIKGLDEYAFESLEVYKRTLDLNAALRENKHLKEVAECRRQYQEAVNARREQEARQAEQQAAQQAAQMATEAPESPQETSKAQAYEKVYATTFKVTATRSALEKLQTFLIDNQIRFDVIEKAKEVIING